MEVAFSHWSASWPVLIGYVTVTAAHLSGLRHQLVVGSDRLPAGSTRQELRREAMMFHLGLLIVVLALVSPVGYWSTVYLWVRAVQTLLIALIGPALIVVGAPWLALRQRVARSSVGSVAAPSASSGPKASPDRRVGRSWPVVQPVLAVVAANLVWLFWALPGPFDLAWRDSAVSLAQHASYLAAGVLFWLQVFGSRPLTPTAPVLRRVALVSGTVVATTLLGMVLVFSSGALYAVHAGAGHRGMTVLDDQQLAGAVWWMGALPALMTAGVALLIQWLNNEDAAELSAGLDRLIMPRKNAWPSRPVIR